MSRLVAFGCSLTYGHGLPDCYIPPMSPGPAPSKFAWPQLVADQLGMTCVNESSPGASNKKIWHSILNFDFRKSDTVFIMWSYAERHAVLKDESVVVDLAPWLVESSLESHSYYNHLYNEYDSVMQTKMYISHANLFLQSRKIKVYNLVTQKADVCYLTLGGTTFSHIPVYISDHYRHKYPRALDGGHPGVDGHAAFARDLIALIETKPKLIEKIKIKCRN